MPRTIAVDCPGCPPVRALTFDVLGLIKLLALARKNAHIELVNPLNGDICASVTPESAVEDPIAGLYLFKKFLQVGLYDASAQRRPVISVDFRESPIKAVTGDLDGHTIYFGTGSGDLASADIRTGKVLGCFLGKCSGGIRSIVRHLELPLIVSCGLDRYLRFWNVKTRQLLSAVFLKQHLTSVVIDSNFSDEVPAVAAVNPLANEEQMDLNDDEDDTSPQLTKKKSSKEGKQKRKSKKTSNVTVEDDDNCIAVNSHQMRRNW